MITTTDHLFMIIKMIIPDVWVVYRSLY